MLPSWASFIIFSFTHLAQWFLTYLCISIRWSCEPSLWKWKQWRKVTVRTSLSWNISLILHLQKKHLNSEPVTWLRNWWVPFSSCRLWDSGKYEIVHFSLVKTKCLCINTCARSLLRVLRLFVRMVSGRCTSLASRNSNSSDNGNSCINRSIKNLL